MAEKGASTIPATATATVAEEKPLMAWPTYSAQDLKRTAISLQQDTSLHLRSFQTQSMLYEDAFFTSLKDGIMHVKDNPVAATVASVASGFLVLRGPRRFLFRHTVGHFQSVEARYSKTENRLKELNLSLDLLKKDSQKLKQRALFGEDEMCRGSTKLKGAGAEIQKLAKSLERVESHAADLRDGLREISGREAIKLRAEVASISCQLHQQKNFLNKQMLQISDFGFWYFRLVSIVGRVCVCGY